MTVRVISLLLASAVGCGVGFSFGHTRTPVEASPVTTPVPTAPPSPTDEVVIEVRVKVPHGAGTVIVPNATRQGSYVNTEAELDLAIEGVGFFPILLADGSIGYTREGVFRRTAEGAIVTAKGRPLSPQITVPQDTTSVCVGTDGTISVFRAGDLGRAVIVGQITLTRFANPAWLKAGPDDSFLETAESGQPIIATPGQNGCGILRQGIREQHVDLNVRSLLELVGVVVKESKVNVKVAGQ